MGYLCHGQFSAKGSPKVWMIFCRWSDRSLIHHVASNVSWAIAYKQKNCNDAIPQNCRLPLVWQFLKCSLHFCHSFTPLSTFQALGRLSDPKNMAQEWCLPIAFRLARLDSLLRRTFLHQYSTRNKVNTIPIPSSSPTIYQLFLRYSFFLPVHLRDSNDP